MENLPAENRPSLALGAALLLVAACFFAFARDIPRTGLAGNTDPGPRALPLAMAAVVAAGGLIELIRGALGRSQPGETATAVATHAAPSETTAAASTSYANLAMLTAAVLVYLLALSWLGFPISTAVFTAGVLMWLGARWWSAILSGVAIVLVVRVLFVGLFHVQLPTGVFF